MRDIEMKYYKLDLAATCKPGKEHNTVSWSKILLLYSQNGVKQFLSEDMLTNCLGKHNPPESCRSSTQAETNMGFVRYIAKLGWLTEVERY
jgi:hypothetical protein